MTLKKPLIWLVKDNEPLPLDPNPRLFRSGLLAQTLIEMGYRVIWFASRFNHAEKTFRPQKDTIVDYSADLQIVLLDGPGYRKNLSLQRIKHQKDVARHFTDLAGSLEKPKLMITNYPAPELCLASSSFARQREIPFFVDARDPWPDSFGEYFPRGLRWTLSPLINHYHGIMRACVKDAAGLLSMSNVMLNWALTCSEREQQPLDRVFYIGYPATPAREINPQPFTESAPLNCIYIGNFGRSYDGMMVIDAMRKLYESGDKRVHCVMVGDGNDGERWRQRATGLSNISFTGWLGNSEMVYQLSRAHVGLIPLRGGISKFWMGNKLFEYTGNSLALLSTAPGETAEVIAREKIGINIPSGQSETLAEALALYATEPAILSQHRENSNRLFMRDYQAKNIYREYAAHVLSVIEPEAKSASLNRVTG